MRPFLDFAFRFEVGYIVNCPINQFGGKPGSIASYLRILPAGGAPVILADSYEFPKSRPK